MAGGGWGRFCIPLGVPGGCFGATCVPKASILLHRVSHFGTFSDPLSKVADVAKTCYLLRFSFISATQGRPGEGLGPVERTRAAARAFWRVWWRVLDLRDSREGGKGRNGRVSAPHETKGRGFSRPKGRTKGGVGQKLIPHAW